MNRTNDSEDSSRGALTLVRRTLEILLEEGIDSLLNKTGAFISRKSRRRWDTHIRPRLPTVSARYNDVSVLGTDTRWFDGILPWYTKDRPNYEAALIRAIREHVDPGSRVVVVGGGRGVSSVVAARCTGPHGRVSVYEGASNAIEQVRATARLNNVDERLEIHHAIVEKSIELIGTAGDSESVSATELPECDVLVLDCEGAETEILNNLSSCPSFIIVETHGLYGSPPDEVESLLTSLEYDVISRTVAEIETLVEPGDDGKLVRTDLEQHCRDNGVFVITATRRLTQ